MFWVSMIFHALLGAALLVSTLLVMRYRCKQGGKAARRSVSSKRTREKLRVA